MGSDLEGHFGAEPFQNLFRTFLAKKVPERFRKGSGKYV